MMNKKSGRARSAPYELEGSDGDKGNTMSGSESMLTYRSEGTEVH
ncbi:hypothetical protein [Neobacillus notoginsengisoli]|nr:hypothetical protein [Neobacillus notoginsengisoli]